MKKTFILIALSCILFFSGCGNVSEIENNRVVTACIVTKTKSDVTYGFYVSVPSGGEGGEDSGSKSSIKVYDFKADNFSDALKNFEKGGAYKADFSHITLFMGNEKYYSENFEQDEEYIRKHMSATPLMYTNVYKGEKNDFFQCIKDEYNSKPEEFAKNIFSANNSYLSCMMSELSLSANNKFYTALIPVIEIKKQGKNKLPEITAVTLFSKKQGIEWVNGKDFNSYSNWRKNFRNITDGYKIKKDENGVKIILDDYSFAQTAIKYAQKKLDILNVEYYLKKNFLTYEKYKDYISNFDISKTQFSGGGI